MKLLVVSSSLDLRYPFSCTPAWWQLLKGLYEENVEVIAVAYQGKTIESLWWKAYENPCYTEGEIFLRTRNLARKIPGLSKTRSVGSASGEEGLSNKVVRVLSNKLIRPRWERFLNKILKEEKNIDAILILTVPLNHFRGLPSYIKEQHQIPIIYFDGDVPASLPTFEGFHSGFKIYQGADLTEYDGFISNSKGGAEELKKMGAQNVKALYFGADPEIFAPINITQDIDVFFYGHGYEYRKEWIEAMITIPSKKLQERKFAVRATDFDIDIGNTQRLPYASVSKLREYSCRSKLNLCIVRRAHALVYASSSSRPFELAAMGCCTVTNPYNGLEEWFEVGQEMLTVHNADEAIETYEWLLNHDSERKRIGERARERILKDHTYRHRARELVSFIKKF